ncbi:MAG TPA: helix-turn-helix transcriptional regulator [Acidimicrobiales bacterium]
MGRPAEVDASLARARASFERREWRAACEAFGAVDPETLAVDDLERLAIAAYLTGADAESDAAWLRAHATALGEGDERRAAGCAFWLGWNLMFRGDMAGSTGWLGRSRTLLDGAAEECAVHGMLSLVEALQRLERGDLGAALAHFEQAAAIGERCGDPDVLALSRLGRGQVLVARDDLTGGAAQLDEAMVAVIADEVTVPIAGVVYCGVLLECRKTFDARRAREWTEAVTRWCDSQPDLVPYRGQCLVHRSEVLQLDGRWDEALVEAQRACEVLAGHPAGGEAHYQRAELHRLRGDFAAAESGYRTAHERGREPQPGLALLRLAQGDLAAAAASIRRAATEDHPEIGSIPVLASLVEIALAAGDLDAARAASDELAAASGTSDVPLLAAVAGQAKGAVLLAEGDPARALGPLRVALATWQRLGAAYGTARTRVLVAAACQAVGDADAARLELDAARATFEALSAAPDLAAVAALARPGRPARPGGLTEREVEVLQRVAGGLSNHHIAVELGVSVHTVRRHLQNIFAKLGVSSRAAATAFAVRHDLA